MNKNELIQYVTEDTGLKSCIAINTSGIYKSIAKRRTCHNDRFRNIPPLETNQPSGQES